MISVTHRLNIAGLGLVTDRYNSIHDLAPHLPPFDLLDPATISAHDTITQLALRAIHQAHRMAALEKISSDQIALLFQTSWGMIDATVAYLESMLADNGKYASPRHFSRSVYSSAASLAAIHFQIHGPCETLAFERDTVTGPLQYAHRLLAAKRCRRVIVVWAEQTNDQAADLCTRAARDLHRRDYQKYIDRGIGYGAAALVASIDPSPWQINLATLRDDLPDPAEKPFPMTPAISLLSQLLPK
ncbi:MAG: beta-ketoacyl synthase chain length factor [Phycisphaerae bacterium]